MDLAALSGTESHKSGQMSRQPTSVTIQSCRKDASAARYPHFKAVLYSRCSRSESNVQKYMLYPIATLGLGYNALHAIDGL